MTSIGSRPLRLYEQINSGSNVNFMLDFDCDKPITKEDLIEAFKLVKARHPYYQMRIDKSSSSTPTFVHEPDLDAHIDIEKFNLTSSDQFDEWRSRLVKLASNADNSNSLARLELYSCDDRGQRYQLYGCVNHAGN